jgi:hypothetical protein
MKKTIIVLTAGVLFTYATYAQKTQVGFTGGASLSNYKAETNGQDESSNSKTGFTFGLIANLPAGKNFRIQPGVHWVQKGTKDEQDNGGGTEKISLLVNVIEVPVNFLYTSGGFFIGAGPAFSLSVSGKLKEQFGGDEISAKIKFGNSDNDNMKRFDLGANVLAGYQFHGGFLIMANFNRGFSNLAPTSSDNGKLKSHYFGLRLGYLLKSKK